MDTSGILVVDKPPDITSAVVVATVKRMLNVKKIGHTGTLDPFATGVMILCLNRATRLSRFFLHGRKTYAAELALGVATDTQDATGRVLSRAPAPAVRLSETTIREAMARFEGDLDQTPPVYSALKHEGTPLYKLARQGTPVQKAPRRVTIERIRPTFIAPPAVHFTVTCSAGTYIRTLCSDIGDALGCGGHLASLRRIESSGFTLDEAVSLPALETLAEAGRAGENIVPMPDALKGMPAHGADNRLVRSIGHGKPLTAKEIPPAAAGPDGLLKIVAARDPSRLIGVVRWRADREQYDYCCVFQENEAPSPAGG